MMRALFFHLRGAHDEETKDSNLYLQFARILLSALNLF
jgi:hypothetical protein